MEQQAHVAKGCCTQLALLRKVHHAPTGSLAGRGWRHIHEGHVRWQKSVGRALSTASAQTRRTTAALTRLGVFETLVALHYAKAAHLAALDPHVSSLIRSYRDRAEELVWSNPMLRKALLSHAARMSAQRHACKRPAAAPTPIGAAAGTAADAPARSGETGRKLDER